MCLRRLHCRPSFHRTPAFSRTLSISAMAVAAQAPGSAPAVPPYTPRYIDIGINLADPIFRGRYHHSQKHQDDLEAVIGRAREVGCTKLMVTGSDFKSVRDSLKLAEEYPGTVYATAGIHPCSSAIFSSTGRRRMSDHTTPCGPDPSAPIPEDHAPDPKRSANIIADLTALLAEARSSGQKHLVAMGEVGLDYDRLHYCNKAVQLHSFAAQLRVAASLEPQLPLFLHSRAAHSDFVSLLKGAFGDRLERLEKGGVVHSFTGTAEEMRELMDLGLYIGINGCSFKTAENCAVVREVHLDRIMLETDGPWCEVRPSHEGWKYLVEKKSAQEPAENGTTTPTDGQLKPQKQSKKNQKKESEVPERFKVVKKEKWEQGAMVKGRNEPCNIERVAKVVAGIKGVSVEEVCEAAWRNTVKVFELGQEN
ncbi:Deoxyribonuclease Tat-D [Tolypocladium ophioglossoides CBS 100239]|uniref:Deoxyribonuclease Tat-D n=1 Tax=Tolypocladium ophioglossoides (strain CBS 100239) TaxID=1163406 RepID=A0A0L0NJ94_TOLOC|nr:Deoxyribonuclease Tat-D [Tolypocladium ophioglossoides CBS 100239]